MATLYPGALDTLNSNKPTPTSPRNNPSLAGAIDNLEDALQAVENTLGTNPQGSAADVKTRLTNIETAAAANASSLLVWIAQ